MKHVFPAIAFLFFCCCASAWAQELTLPSYRQYTMRDGMPQPQVVSLFQDSRGYIWVGTKNGVARFNGETFHNFTSKDGLPHGEVKKIAEDQRGRILAFCTRGVAIINGDSLTGFPQTDFQFRSFELGGNDTVWIVGNRRETDKSVLGYFAHGQYRMEDTPSEVSGEIFRTHFIKYDKHQRALFTVSHHGIYKYLPGGPKKVAPHPPYSEGYSVHFAQTEGRAIVVHHLDGTDNLQFFTVDDHGLHPLARHADGAWPQPPPDGLKEHILSFGHHVGTHYVVRGEVYANSETPDQFLTAVLGARDGSVWLGSERGLIRKFSHAFTHYNPALLPEVWGITESPQGRLWFSSYGFDIKSLQNNQLTAENFNTEKRFYYFHPVAGDNGAIYFPYNHGITKRLANGTVRELFYESMGDHICFYAYYDKERRHLLGAFRGNVAVWDENDRLVREIGRASGTPVAGYVLCIGQDSARNYWFGGPDIFRYNWDEDSLVQYPTAWNQGSCTDIATDHTGRTWFATRSGLLYYDPAGDTLKKVDVPELRDIASFVLPLDKSRLLTSQPDGLYILNLDEFNRSGEMLPETYNASNGYNGEEPGQAGAFKDSRGDVWITSGSMLCRLRPHLLPKGVTPQANIVFTRCNNAPVSYDDGDVRLSFNQRSATVVFDAVAFNRTSTVAYSYRTGKNKNWSPPQAHNYVVLTDLPHGKTELHVRPVFGAHASNEEYTLLIRVNKAFYNQTWFVPLLMVLLLLALSLLILANGRTRAMLEKAARHAKMSEVETIQAQMNPHFVYNVLANVQSKIRATKPDEAEASLLKLARLMRSFLHTATDATVSDKEDNPDITQHLVTLQHELGLLREFVDFQQMLYPAAFVYDLSIDNDADISAIRIPPMLLQPFVENAISHGLIPKKGVGRLHIHVAKDPETGKTVIRISDDGIGMEQAQKQQEQSKLRYPSRGRKLTMQRIGLLNELGFRISVNTHTSENGTTVEIVL